MSLGVRGKLFLVSLLLILSVGGASGIYFELTLRQWLEAQVEDQLRMLAKASSEALLAAPRLDDVKQVDLIADRLGAASDTRITVIGSSGRVLGDSSLSPGQIEDLANHGERPEILGAKNHGFGTSRRFSSTVDTDMLYVALPFERPEGTTFVRVSMPLGAVERTIDRLRMLLILAGMVGLGIAVLMSLLASHLSSRALRKLVANARDLAGGAGHRIEIGSSDEIGRLAGSFNRLAEQLQHTLADLARERERFEVVLESMTEAVVVIDAHKRVTLANAAALKLLDLKGDWHDEALDFVVPVPSLGELAEQALKGPASLDFGLEQPARRLLARATPLPDGRGAVITMLDVTETRRLEMVRKDFVANVSHELRTPVSIVRANAETLLEGALDDPSRARGFVEALHRHAERLSRIIADLLDLSKMEAGRYRFEFRNVDLVEAAGRALETMGAKADARKQELDVEIPDDLEARADVKALDHVLSNLLDNAIKYAPEGGQIWMRAKEDGEMIRFEVEDNGTGIAPEHQERIFERFYRVDAGRSRDTGGTGLGLAIVKHLVEAMQGKVGVTCGQGKGSCFWFTIPKAKLSSRRAA